jgi:hypothetical protein
MGKRTVASALISTREEIDDRELGTGQIERRWIEAKGSRLRLCDDQLVTFLNRYSTARHSKRIDPTERQLKGNKGDWNVAIGSEKI